MNRRWTSLALVVSMAAVAPLALAGDEVSSVSPVAEAVKALEKGERAKAAEIAGKVDETHPERAKARYVLGECLLADGKAEEAKAAFEEVLKSRPAAVPAQVGLGRSQLALGQAEESEKTLRAAVKAAPRDGAAQRSLGETLSVRKKDDEALKALREALKIDRKDPLAARSLCEFHLQREQLDSAAGVAETLVKADGKAPMGWFLRGLVADRRGKDEDAIDAYEKAIAKDDTFLDAHKNLAIVCTTRNPLYQDTARTKKAFKHYARYFELGGRDNELKGIYETIKGYLEQNGFDTGK